MHFNCIKFSDVFDQTATVESKITFYLEFLEHLNDLEMVVFVGNHDRFLDFLGRVLNLCQMKIAMDNS